MDAMRYAIALSALLSTRPLCEPESPPYVPPTITFEDGHPAREAGPFLNRIAMRNWLGEFCGGPYTILDGDDQATAKSKGHAVSYEGVAVSRGEVTEKHSITVIFRCNQTAAAVSDGGVGPDASAADSDTF